MKTQGPGPQTRGQRKRGGTSRVPGATPTPQRRHVSFMCTSLSKCKGENFFKKPSSMTKKKGGSVTVITKAITRWRSERPLRRRRYLLSHLLPARPLPAPKPSSRLKPSQSAQEPGAEPPFLRQPRVFVLFFFKYFPFTAFLLSSKKHTRTPHLPAFRQAGESSPKASHGV